MSEEHDIKNQKCYAYFKGKDGLGTCNSECQWYQEGKDCPYWLTEEEYYEKQALNER